MAEKFFNPSETKAMSGETERLGPGKPENPWEPEMPSVEIKEPWETESPAIKAWETEKPEKQGGSYAEVKENSDGSTHEVHHMPADSASELPRGDGPAIKMEKEDHRETASWGLSKEAQEYRQKQKELIEQGKFSEAFEMDVADIKEKFPDGRYDEAIAEAREYVKKLEEEGRV